MAWPAIVIATVKLLETAGIHSNSNHYHECYCISTSYGVIRMPFRTHEWKVRAWRDTKENEITIDMAEPDAGERLLSLIKSFRARTDMPQGQLSSDVMACLSGFTMVQIAAETALES